MILNPVNSLNVMGNALLNLGDTYNAFNNLANDYFGAIKNGDGQKVAYYTGNFLGIMAGGEVAGGAASRLSQAGRTAFMARMGEGAKFWPSNKGAIGGENMTTLQIGTRIDRYGWPKGNFASPEGTPFSNRSLPSENIKLPFNSYEVVRPISVHESIISPWFEQLGYGTQYRFTNSIQYYLDNGFLK